MTERLRPAENAVHAEPTAQVRQHAKGSRPLPPLSLEKRMHIQTLFECRITRSVDIAEIAEVSISTAQRYRKKVEMGDDILQDPQSTAERVISAISTHTSTSIRDIAGKIGVPNQRVSQIILAQERQLGRQIIQRKSSPHTAEEDRETTKYIGELNAQGFSTEEILMLTGRGQTFVNRILSKIKTTTEAFLREKRDAQIVDLRKQGLGNEAIGKALNIPKWIVTDVVEKLGAKDPKSFRLRKKRSTKEEMQEYDNKVLELLAQKLTRSEMAIQLQAGDQSLEHSRFAVINAVNRIKKREAKENVIFDAQNQGSPLDA